MIGLVPHACEQPAAITLCVLYEIAANFRRRDRHAALRLTQPDADVMIEAYSIFAATRDACSSKHARARHALVMSSSDAALNDVRRAFTG